MSEQYPTMPEPAQAWTPPPGGQPVYYPTAQQYPRAPPAVLPPSPNRHEGLAVAALVLGIIAVVFGAIPLTFILAWVLGALAVIFGGIGRRPTKGKWGLALGIVAIVLGVIGVIIINGAVDNDSSGAASVAVPTATVPFDVPTDGAPLDVPTSPDADTGYLDGIHSTAKSVDTYTDDQLIGFGHAVCTDFAGGNTWAETLQDSLSAGFDAYDSGALIADAVTFYCPEYLGDLPN
jgi:hypothetical protein